MRVHTLGSSLHTNTPNALFRSGYKLSQLKRRSRERSFSARLALIGAPRQSDIQAEDSNLLASPAVALRDTPADIPLLLEEVR